MLISGAPRVLVLRAAGINCDEETADACDLAGGRAERVHVNQIDSGACNLLDFAALVIPGGFSYGDHLGAGKLLAVDMVHRIGVPLRRFVEEGRPVLGICNGFQVLVKAGLLPGLPPGSSAQASQTVTLVHNASGHYECRWIRLRAEPGSRSIFTRGIEQVFSLPVGHGEGRFVAPPEVLDDIERRGLVALRYVNAEGEAATDYPDNPNGSLGAIAGVCDHRGTVFGLMPHPDRAFLPQLHPDWLRFRSRTEGDGLAIFRNMIRYAGEL